MPIKVFILVEDYDNHSLKNLEVNAFMLDMPMGNQNHFAHRNPGIGPEWYITEYSTGAMVGCGPTIKSALSFALRRINEIGEEAYKVKLDEAIAVHGKANLGNAPAPSNIPYNQMEEELNTLYIKQFANV